MTGNSSSILDKLKSTIDEALQESQNMSAHDEIERAMKTLRSLSVDDPLRCGLSALQLLADVLLDQACSKSPGFRGGSAVADSSPVRQVTNHSVVKVAHASTMTDFSPSLTGAHDNNSRTFGASLYSALSFGQLGFQNEPLSQYAQLRERLSKELEQSLNPLLNFSASQCVIQQTRELIKMVDKEGNKMINRYTVIDDLGRGAYGKVKLAVDETNCPVAIKIVRKDLLKQLDGKNGIAREIAVMKKLKHRNVVQLYEVIDDPESEKMYMVMKYVDQGPIGKVLPDNTCKVIPVQQMKEIMVELVSGLSYLHKRGVAHRDIKPDNILLDSAGTPYFTDFGVSEIIDRKNPNVSTVEGTAPFMPPELFDDQALNVNVFAADVWSLGVTLYLLLYGTMPFKGANFREIASNVRTSELIFPETSRVGEEWEDLLRGMLNKVPSERMTLNEVENHRALYEAAITDDDLELATTCIRNFLPIEEPVLAAVADASLLSSIRMSFVAVPRCAHRRTEPLIIPVAGRMETSLQTSLTTVLIGCEAAHSPAPSDRRDASSVPNVPTAASVPSALKAKPVTQDSTKEDQALSDRDESEKPLVFVQPEDDEELPTNSFTAIPDGDSCSVSSGSTATLAPSPPPGARSRLRPLSQQLTGAFRGDDSM